jgi:hypothetical protein
MENSQESRNRRNHKARVRQQKRRQRHEVVSNIASEALPKLPPIKIPNALQGLWTLLIDNLWQMREQGMLANLGKIGGLLVAVILLFFALSVLFSPSIGPNISTLGISLGGKSMDEATEALFTFWNEGITISLLADGQVFAEVRPAEMGLHLDAAATAQAAKNAGLSGLPFGKEIEPVITADYGEVQSYMLSLGAQVFIPAYEAGYQWRDGQLVSVAGSPSRELDIVLSVQQVVDAPLSLIKNRYIELVTNSTAPIVIDADPYYEEALAFVNSEFIIEGYDPFKDETLLWGTTREQMAGWLLVTDNGLTIREEGLEPFISYINNSSEFEDPVQPRYIDPGETYEAIKQAFTTGAQTAVLRIRYEDTTFVLQEGDWGHRLSRRTGLPFLNINSANPGVIWEEIYAGDRINLPSRDLVVPLPPVPNKRIIVDLERFWLVAYENGEVIYNWPISIGREQAPTNPGVFQILDKTEVALGSGFALCNENAECGQWEMSYFMSIYQVGNGLTNGFHGRVILPNGGNLNGGSQQTATTYGCVMSDEEQARLLYDWADVGVVVEIVSDEYPPQSQTALAAMDFITAATGES